MRGNNDLRLERFEFRDIRLDIFDGHERAQKAEAFDGSNRGGEEHAFFWQPNRRVGITVNILELDQLQSSFAQVQGHAALKLQVRGDHAKAAERLAHLA